MNGLHFCFGAGALVAPVIVASSIRATNDIAMAYWTLGGVTLAIAACFVWIPRAPDPVRAQHDQAEPGQPRLVALIAAVFACYVAAEVAYGGWISTYGLELGFGDAAETAYLASVFWGMLTFGRLIGIPLASRFRAGTLIAVDHAGALVCLIAILCAPSSAGGAVDRNRSVRLFPCVDLPDAAGLLRRTHVGVWPEHELVSRDVRSRGHDVTVAHRTIVRRIRPNEPAVARRTRRYVGCDRVRICSAPTAARTRALNDQRIASAIRSSTYVQGRGGNATAP